ncbi:MAG: GDSL-type esterase/lipase family protein [Lachnospiraceae bacterium]|nr:GDSL-type esterase/lipase family protein [Lachnospiraceae bacterium]
MKITNYKRLLFAGDSITDADHLWEPGFDGLGNGFVHMISEMLKLQAALSEPPVIINSGFNGYRAEDLLRRWNQVCLSKNPDLVTLLVGVNEAGAAMEGMITTPDMFRRTYTRLITEVLENTQADMILVEPFLFDRPAYLIAWRKYFDPLLPVIGELAEEYHLPLLRLDQPLNELAERLGTDAVTRDGIHLTETGNRFLAEAWLRLVNA